MFPSPLDSDAAAVCSRYPSFCCQGTLTPLGNHGGFSGAVLWRIDSPAETLCLRAWPPHETWPQLLFRHRLMSLARQNGLHFIPTIFATLDGASAVEHAGRLWELTDWLPGRADYHQHTSTERLDAACTALAQLHRVWRSLASAAASCPAVQRRLTFVEEWKRLNHSGWHPLAVAEKSDPLRPIVERAWRQLEPALVQVPRRLQRWLGGNPRVQPCLCDLWHDHLLFEGGRLTGLIDYGAVKVDHVAVDLARMLGSLVGDDADGWRSGLQAYRRLAPLTTDEEELAHALDETGIVLGVASWLRWLYEEKRPFPDRKAVARRLTELVMRMETLIM
ncbi:MAG TPA: phosphotransferase [Gemmataceae bacterium]|nr:phosphotransferase [Gemmataceae bacterium]